MAASEGDAEQWRIDQGDRKTVEDIEEYGAAIIDRLVHHANIFYVNGSSYRLKDKLKKGQSPN